MVEILFIYNGNQIKIQCNTEDKMKDIFNRFKIKSNEEDDNLRYIYHCNIINEELKLNQIINNNNETHINILVYNNKNKDEKDKEILLNEIICPKCKENILIDIKDYKINLYGCKNGHKIENILFSEYENMQKIDLSKIICDKCSQNNINQIFNKELYICNNCGISLCPLCKSKQIIILLNIKINIIYVKSIMIDI